jgi:hypothetical protein
VPLFLLSSAILRNLPEPFKLCRDYSLPCTPGYDRLSKQGFPDDVVILVVKIVILVVKIVRGFGTDPEAKFLDNSLFRTRSDTPTKMPSR